MSTDIYPLLVERKLEPRIWGGSRLGPWLGLTDAPPKLAESWQVFDTNTILNGSLAGTTLADVARTAGASLVGSRPFARYGADVPLLAKFLDAAEPLSVQVHPDDAYAHSVEAASGFHGKTEAWYILDADPGSSLIYGFREAVSREQVAAAIAAESLMPLLRELPVAAGDVVLVPAGTVHAIGGGITLFEIQQKSDLTYRLYDYGRRDAAGNLRELHVERGLAVSDTSGRALPLAQPLPLDDAGTRTLLVACPFFALEKLMVSSSWRGTTNPGSLEILTAIGGNGALEWSGGTVAFGRGESLVLPAALGPYRLLGEQGLVLLRCYVPDLERGLLAPLRSRGLAGEQVAQTVFELS